MDILQRDRLLKFGAVPFTTDVIAGEFGDYSAVLAKIAALVDEGSLVRIKRGLYCLSPKISGHDLDSRVVANALYGPSYVSFETALSMYGLIPERVTATMSACVHTPPFPLRLSCPDFQIHRNQNACRPPETPLVNRATRFSGWISTRADHQAPFPATRRESRLHRYPPSERLSRTSHLAPCDTRILR